MKLSLKLQTLLIAVFAAVQTNVALAQYDIGAPKTGGFAKIGQFFQEIVNLLDGPGVLLVSFISIFAVVGLYMLFPKAQGAMAWALRVFTGAIVILNIGTWIAWLRF